MKAILIQKEGKLFVKRYPCEKPKKEGYLGTVSFSEILKQWEESAQINEVHPSQVEAFETLAMNNWISTFTKEIFQEQLLKGIEIPSERIYFEYRETEHKDELGGYVSDIEYAFRYPNKEESKDNQDEMFLNMQYYMEYCQSKGYVTPQEWIEKHKHF